MQVEQQYSAERFCWIKKNQTLAETMKIYSIAFNWPLDKICNETHSHKLIFLN